MTILDVVVLIVLIYGGVVGALRGFLVIAFDVLAVFGGLWVAWFYYDQCLVIYQRRASLM